MLAVNRAEALAAFSVENSKVVHQHGTAMAALTLKGPELQTFREIRRSAQSKIARRSRLPIPLRC